MRKMKKVDRDSYTTYLLLTTTYLDRKLLELEFHSL